MTFLDRLSGAMRRLADRRVLLASGVAFLALATIMFATSGPGSLAAVADRCGQPAPDVRLATSPEGVSDFLVACGDAGRAAYRDLQLADLVYPAVVGLLLASALAMVLSRAARRTTRPVLALAALPLLASAFDYLENVAAWTVLIRHPDTATWVARLYSVASPAKQLLTWASVVLLAGALVEALVVRLRHGRSGRADPTPVASR